MSLGLTCPSCDVSLDGDLVIDTLIEQYDNYEEALRAASMYAGFKEHGLENRWSRRISIYNLNKDMTDKYRCPDCNHEWSRFSE